MKKIFAITAVAALLASPALALNIGGGSNNTNTNANTNQQAQGQAQGQIQGQGQSQSSNNTNVNAISNNVGNVNSVRNNSSASITQRDAASSAVAPSIGGGGCNVGVGLGLSEMWGSMSTGISWRNVPCAVQHEAAQFMAMGMKREAVTHLAMFHKRMGKTLKATGAVSTAPKETTSTRNSPATATPVMYRTCKRDDAGRLVATVARGATEATKRLAADQCRAAMN